MKVKECKDCGITKDITEFYRGGKTSVCKSCYYARNKSHRIKRYNNLKNKIQGNTVTGIIERKQKMKLNKLK